MQLLVDLPVSQGPSGAAVLDGSQVWTRNTDQAPTAQRALCRLLDHGASPTCLPCSSQAHQSSQLRTQGSSPLLGRELCLLPQFPSSHTGHLHLPNNHTCSSADPTQTRAFPVSLDLPPIPFHPLISFSQPIGFPSPSPARAAPRA